MLQIPFSVTIVSDCCLPPIQQLS